MKVLVTGGTGFIGSHLAESLSARGHQVHLMDIETGWWKELYTLQGASFVKCSVDNYGGVYTRLRSFDPDEIVHLAGISHTVASALGQRAALKPGVVGLATLQDAVREVYKKGPYPRISIASSSLLSGMILQPCVGRPPENIEPIPNCGTLIDLKDCYHQYCDNKLMMEMLCHSNQYQFNLPFTVFRFGTQYGPRMKPNVVTWYFIRDALLGKPLQVHGDGKQVRQHFYVEDLVDGVVKILENREKFENKTVSIVPDEMSSVLGIAHAVQEAVPGAAIQHVNKRSIDVKVRKIERPQELYDVGWQIRYNLKDGIAKTVEYYRKRMDLVKAGLDRRIEEKN